MDGSRRTLLKAAAILLVDQWASSRCRAFAGESSSASGNNERKVIVVACGGIRRAETFSAAGLGIAILTAFFYPESAYVYLFGISLFGGLFAWLVIFVTHLAFRKKWAGPPLPVRMIGYPYTSLIGIAAIVAILATTWWTEGMQPALIAGIPWLGVLTIAYFLVSRRQAGTVAE